MILEMNNEQIIIKQNSVESMGNVVIYTKFLDVGVGSNDTIKIFIDGHELEQLSKTSWKFDCSLLTYQQSILKVTLKTSTEFKIYSKAINVEKYISFGKMEIEKLPQVYIDINNRLKLLEDRLKKLELTKTII